MATSRATGFRTVTGFDVSVDGICVRGGGSGASARRQDPSHLT